jgi:hypothetical protein
MFLSSDGEGKDAQRTNVPSPGLKKPVTWHWFCTSTLPWGGRKGIGLLKTRQLGRDLERNFFLVPCISTYLSDSSHRIR